MSVALSACSAAGDSVPVHPDDELVLAVGSIGDGEFDPLRGWGSHNEHSLIHSSLIHWVEEDGQMKLDGDLATSFHHDATTLTFELDPSYAFSDGTPVTAEDVRFTLDMLKEDGTQFDLSNVTDIEAPDEHTVVITLDNPDSLFEPELASIPIVPKHAYGPDYSKNPIGSGPYRVVEYRPGEQLIVEANPHYPRALHFKKLTFLLSDTATAMAAARNGGIDVLAADYSMADQDLPGMTLTPVESVETFGITLPTEAPGGEGVTMGQRGPTGNAVTSDIAMRRALATAMNRKQLVDITLNGHGHEAESLGDGLPWEASKTRYIDGDIAAAKKILQDAGWVDTNGDGTVDKGGVEARIPLMYSSADQIRADIAATIAAQMEAIGVRFEPQGVTWDDIYATGKTAAVVFALGSLSPKELWSSYATDAIGVSYNNMPDFSNPEVDEILKDARSSITLSSSIHKWRAAQEAGASSNPDGEVPYIWLFQPDHLYFVRDGLDIGEQMKHGHAHGLQIVANIEQWS